MGGSDDRPAFHDQRERMSETHEGSDEIGRAWARWDDRPSAQQRMAVQHAVTALLDTLAPAAVVARRDLPSVPLQRLRSPRGCILQASARAVTVSWFPASTSDDNLGELQIVAWEGIVSRPGSASRAAGGAREVAHHMLRPVPLEGRTWAWRGEDGAVYDIAALTARCLALLEIEQPPAVTGAP
jgi:hypothetical protein